MALLTKSLFMNGEQCTKLLWYAQRKELPEITLSDRHKFAQGRDFEKVLAVNTISKLRESCWMCRC